VSAEGQDFLIEIDDEAYERLKARAEGNGRSLEEEVRAILERAADEYSLAEAEEALARVRALFAGQTLPDSTDLIREDRER